MIQVTFFQQNHRFCGFSSLGHAEYDEEGWDIVCAAVSALAQTVLAALLEQLSDENDVVWNLHKGFLEVHLSENLPGEEQQIVQVLLKALLTGLNMIQEQYPEYVSVVIKMNGR